MWNLDDVQLTRETLIDACLRCRKEEAQGNSKKERRENDEVGDFRVRLTKIYVAVGVHR